VTPEFHAGEAERVKRKDEELAPYIEAAFKRKQAMPPLADAEIPPVLALGRQIAERAKAQVAGLAPANAARAQATAQWAEALKRGAEKQES
jgi:hypothetical protein